MRRKFTILTAVGLCLVLAFGAALAAERGRDAAADRSKRGSHGAGIDNGSSDSSYFGDSAAQMRLNTAAGGNKARALLQAAYKQEGNVAIATLNQILSMDLPDSPETDRILFGVYEMYANLSEGTARQLQALGMAMQHTADPADRARLQERIESLGGNPVAFAFNGSNAAPTEVGFDTCDDPAEMAVISAVGDLWTSGMFTVLGPDRDWYAFDIVTGDPAVGLELRIETLSTDPPFTYADDSNITLYQGCTAGVPDTYLDFDEDGGVDYLSLILTSCLGPGSYFLEIGTWFDASYFDDVWIEIEALATCEVPQPDEYEPDNTRADASPIGHDKPADNPNALLTGRVAEEIQAHNIFPPGDVDMVKFQLKYSATVLMATQCGFPTIFNNFDPGCDPNSYSLGDTWLGLWYAEEMDYGGLCNQQTAPGSFSILTVPCQTDLDCDLDGDGLVYPDDDDLQYPIAGFPACLPWSLFGSPPVDPAGNTPLAYDDDDGPAFWSSLELCLPSTKNNTPSSTVEDQTPDFSWYVFVRAYSSSQSFDYELMVHNKEKCHFECENNNDGLPSYSNCSKSKQNNNRIEIGEDIHGIYDFFHTFPNPDNDVFSFDVEEESRVIIETDGYDAYNCDTYIDLYVGPDADGNYFFTNVWSEDQGPGWLSIIDVILPPACELLGMCDTGYGKGKGKGVEAPSYWLRVTSNYYNPNFPYTVHTTLAQVPILEDPDLTGADFGDCLSGTEAIVGLGSEVFATFDPTCDYDGYKWTIDTNTDIDVETAGTDTVMQLIDCGTGEILACDEDGGTQLFASRLTGCLPGGYDYCFRIRPYSGFASGVGYSVTFNGSEGCTATWPPTLVQDNSYKCSDFPLGDIFDTCP